MIVSTVITNRRHKAQSSADTTWFPIVGIIMCFQMQSEVLAPSTTECGLL